MPLRRLREFLNREQRTEKDLVEPFKYLIQDDKYLTLPVYSPPETHPLRVHIANAQIPRMRSGQPSLLLHRLPVDDSIFKTPRHEFVIRRGQEMSTRAIPNIALMFGVSGCGKTRTIFELLSTRFGLYFDLDPNRAGSDIQELHRILLSLVPEQLTSGMADHAARCLLLGRVLVLYELTSSRSGKFTPDAWLKMQLLADTIPIDFSDSPLQKDPFGLLFERLYSFTAERVADMLSETLDLIVKGNDKRDSNLYVFIDEAQVWCHLLPNAFISETSGEKRAFIARFMSVICSYKDLSVFFAGTALRLNAALKLLTSHVAKQGGTNSVNKFLFTSFDRMKNYESVKRYLQSVFGKTNITHFFGTGRECSVVVELINRLAGRPRFLAFYVSELCMSTASTSDVRQTLLHTLNTVEETLFGSPFNPSSLAYWLEELQRNRRPTSIYTIPIQIASSSSSSSTSSSSSSSASPEPYRYDVIFVLEQLRAAYLLTGGMATFPSHHVECFVDYGICYLDVRGDELCAYVCEPLVVKAINAFFAKHKPVLFENLLSYPGMTASARGLLIEQHFPEAIFKQFGSRPFSQHALFQPPHFSDKLPDWFLSYRLRGNTPSCSMGSGLAKLLSDSHQNGTGRVQFLLPDQNAGPDLVFVLADGRKKGHPGKKKNMLCLLQSKVYAGNLPSATANHGWRATDIDRTYFTREGEVNLKQKKNHVAVNRSRTNFQASTLRILFAFPGFANSADIPHRSCVVNDDIALIITKDNASLLLSEDIIRLLNCTLLL
eukprot:GILJ01011421.1.p1 GENE.GILJ01011421.1~~GILJ01011421.1.p1  ORF type:complete len:775 (-),score=46.62 GILJ01011421.1:179-2503(-)